MLHGGICHRTPTQHKGGNTMKWEKEDCPTDLRVNGVSKAPDHDERGSHDDVGRVVDAFI